MRHVIIVILSACACLCGAVVALADTPPESGTTTGTTETTDTSTRPDFTHVHLQRSIDRYRHRTWRWQRVMQRPLTLRLSNPPTEPLARIRVWKQFSARVETVATHPPHLRQWTCIHRYEGSWADSGAPYYGGLQMDLGFQRAYGAALLARKGTANNWTPLEQMWVAERALSSGRGFWPWPNTARMCGLI
jgi:hypothetical protein